METLFKILRILTSYYPFMRGTSRICTLLDLLYPNFSQPVWMLTRSGKSVPKFMLDISQKNNRKFYFFTKQLYKASYNSNLGGLLKKLLKQGDTFIDIGANVGIYSFLATKIIGSTGKVISIEPDPNTFYGLSKSVKLNGYSQIRCINLALSNCSGEAQFYVGDDSVGNSLLSSFEYDSVKKVKVETFDRVLSGSNLEKIRLIKIDVEGAEYLTIQGMKGFLKSGTRPPIFCEVRGAASTRNPNTYNSIKDFLKKFNYIPYQKCKHQFNPITNHQKIGADVDIEDVLFLNNDDSTSLELLQIKI